MKIWLNQEIGIDMNFQRMIKFLVGPRKWNIYEISMIDQILGWTKKMEYI